MDKWTDGWTSGRGDAQTGGCTDGLVARGGSRRQKGGDDGRTGRRTTYADGRLMMKTVATSPTSATKGTNVHGDDDGRMDNNAETGDKKSTKQR